MSFRINPETGVFEKEVPTWGGFSSDWKECDAEDIQEMLGRKEDSSEYDSYYSSSSTSTEATQSDKPKEDNFFQSLCFFILAMFLVGLFFTSLGKKQLAENVRQTSRYTQPYTSTGPVVVDPYQYGASVPYPPETLVDFGACPSEQCHYDEQWLAKQNVSVYLTIPHALNVPTASLTKIAEVKMGEWVKTLSGAIIAPRQQAWIGEMTNAGRGINLSLGQRIFIYSSLGENPYKAWADGRIIQVNSPEYKFIGLAEDIQEWWVKIRLSNGLVGWVKNPKKVPKSFISQENLNNELSMLILDQSLPPDKKLSLIDLLTKNGASLNGGVGQHEAFPIEAAIRSQDIGLIKELMLRGLDFRHSSQCLADWVSWHVLKPGSEAVLDFLLQNGMTFDCIPVSPYEKLLGLGIATDGYSLEQAVKVAEVLDRHGFRLDQKDLQGQTYLERLDDWLSLNTGYRKQNFRLRQALLDLDEKQKSGQAGVR